MTTPSPTGPAFSRSVEQLLTNGPVVDGDREARLDDWLRHLALRYGGIIERVLAPEDAARALQMARGGTVDDPRLQETWPSARLRERASTRAQANGESRVVERHVIEAVLDAAGYRCLVVGVAGGAAQTGESTARGDDVAGDTGPAGSWRPRVRRPTPTLDQFGTDLTRMAAEGRLSPMIGRTEELNRIVHTLCRRIKRNPLLVGAAGTGKTAIVEGLAQRIVDGAVPAPLIGARIVALQPSSLVAGTHMAGEFERRVKAVLTEASQDGLLLFIDEIHTALGAGGKTGTGDLSQHLKPALARGDFACIAATTDDEHRRYIAPDEALSRRFDTIKVHELTADETFIVLQRMRDDMRMSRGVLLGDAALRTVISFGEQYLRNRRFPDKAVDLFDHVVAAAINGGRTESSPAEVDEVLRELLGVPNHDGALLARLETRLVEEGLLTDDDAEALSDRLSVTMHGLDLDANRPNLVALLLGDAADRVDDLAAVLAEVLYGSTSRVVNIDLSAMADEHAVSALIGSPAGYIGYADRHALDEVAESPWTVVVARGVDRAHPRVRAVISSAIVGGVVTDLRGKRIYFSDAVLLLTADASDVDGPSVNEWRGSAVGGFHDEVRGGATDEAERDEVTRLIGARSARLIDLLVRGRTPRRATKHAAEGATYRAVLSLVDARLEARGVSVHWDVSITEWLVEAERSGDLSTVEQLVEREVLPAVVQRAFGMDGHPEANGYVARWTEGGIEVLPRPRALVPPTH